MAATNREERLAFLLETEPERSLQAEIEKLVDPVTGAYAFPALKAFDDYKKIQAEGHLGRGQVVAIVDTGIDTTHPLLKDAVIDARDFTAEGTTQDLHRHGTLVALIIRYAAPQAKLINAKAFDKKGSARESTLAKALDWVRTKQPNVVNLSAGLPSPDPANAWPGFLRSYLNTKTRTHWLVSLLRRHWGGNCPVCAATDRLSAGGAIVCVAVGNRRGEIMCPGRTKNQNLMVIGAADGGGKTIPKYSAFWPDLVAPELPVAEGTSFSTPFVSGLCALLGEAAQSKAAAAAAPAAQSLQQADALFAAGNYPEAVRIYAAALAVHPHLAEHAAGKIAAGACLRCQAFIYPARTKQGLALLQMGRPLEALAAFKQNAEIAPKFADAHMNVGAALREAGMLDESVACFQRAIQLNPNKAEAYDGLGDAFEKAGASDRAIEAFGRSRSINPRRAYPVLRLANLYDAAGDHRTAAACRAAAASLN